VITYIEGDLFLSPAQVLVNTVNTVGVMGKGVAKDFKRLYPDMFKLYRQLCEEGKFGIGQLLLYKTPHKWVLNFPTKKDWRKPSRPEYIEAGLQKLTAMYTDAGIHSIAMPLLGCGNGELNWSNTVRPLVEKHLAKAPLQVFVHSYFQRAPLIPEHRDIDKIALWLRSEPEHLAFAEVWEDLSALLANRQDFKTLAKADSFRAWTVPDGIRLAASDRTDFVSRSELLDFWQQLRVHGFTSRQIAPTGLNRRYSYLMPLFAALPYVKPVRMADEYEQISGGRETIGLQYIPELSTEGDRLGGLFGRSITI